MYDTHMLLGGKEQAGPGSWSRSGYIGNMAQYGYGVCITSS